MIAIELQANQRILARLREHKDALKKAIQLGLQTSSAILLIPRETRAAEEHFSGDDLPEIFFRIHLPHSDLLADEVLTRILAGVPVLQAESVGLHLLGSIRSNPFARRSPRHQRRAA